MSVILIIEDNEDNRVMLKTLLEIWHYTVLEAADGLEALKLAERERPDLIIMDAKIPFLDGFEATRRIRQSAAISHTPIVFLSGCAETISRKKAFLAGADEYLVKPVDFDKLRNTLNIYIPQSVINFTW